MKKKKMYLRRWTFEVYFASTRQFVDVPLAMIEEEVRAKVEGEYGRDGWKKDTLRREGKVKVR